MTAGFGKDVPTEERCSSRKLYSAPLLKRLKQMLDEQSLVTLPKSPLGMAIAYTQRNWDALNVYVTDGDLTIDNNLAENALRPIALGRKNWMFAGSDAGGRTIAIISSIVATCRRLKVDPFKYLKSVIEILTENPDVDLTQIVPDVLQLPA